MVKPGKITTRNRTYTGVHHPFVGGDARAKTRTEPHLSAAYLGPFVLPKCRGKSHVRDAGKVRAIKESSLIS